MEWINDFQILNTTIKPRKQLSNSLLFNGLRKINNITVLIPSCIDIHVTKGSIKGYLHRGSTMNKMPSAEPKKKQMDTQKQKETMTHFARNF